MNTELERPLPHSADAERGILGALLVGNVEASSILDQLTTEDFFFRLLGASRKLIGWPPRTQ